MKLTLVWFPIGEWLRFSRITEMRCFSRSGVLWVSNQPVQGGSPEPLNLPHPCNNSPFLRKDSSSMLQ